MICDTCQEPTRNDTTCNSCIAAELRRDMLSDTPARLHVGCHECGRAYDDAQIAICHNPNCSTASTCDECGTAVNGSDTLCEDCNAEYEERADREMRAGLHRSR